MNYFDDDSDEASAKKPKFDGDNSIKDDSEEEPETLSAVIALEV